jgi:hypothetical protein
MNLKSGNMITIAIKDFAKKKICDGHLFLKTKEGRRFYVLKPGILIDPAFVKKHASLNSVFEYEPLADQAVIQRYISLFRELKYLQFEKDLRLKSGEILQYFLSVHGNGGHFLSFVLACYQEFCNIPQETLLKMHDTEIHYFRKTTYSAAFSILLGLSNDFYHYPMIKDFYNITMMLDYGICDNNYSYFVAQACNQENLNPGSGRDWLVAQKASAQELNVFSKHPEKSYEFIKMNKDILSHPELAEIVMYQHELSAGNGFPRGIPKGLVSSWEAVVLLADSLVDIRDEYQFETTVLDYIHNYQNKKLQELPVNKAFQKLTQALRYFDEIKDTGT